MKQTDPNRLLLKAALRGINPLASPTRFYEHSRIFFRPGQMWSQWLGVIPQQAGHFAEVEMKQDPSLFYCLSSHEAPNQFNLAVEKYQGVSWEQMMELASKYSHLRVELTCELYKYGQQVAWNKTGRVINTNF